MWTLNTVGICSSESNGTQCKFSTLTGDTFRFLDSNTGYVKVSNNTDVLCKEIKTRNMTKKQRCPTCLSETLSWEINPYS